MSFSRLVPDPATSRRQRLSSDEADPGLKYDGAVQTRPEVSYLPAYVALERWWLAKRVAIVSPQQPEGPRRLAAAGTGRVLVLGAPMEASPGVEVWAGPLPSPLRLPLRDASVDAVLCIEAYAGLTAGDRAALVSEARRVLRPKGVLALWCTDLPATEALLRPAFLEIAALAQLRWSGISLAPVGPAGANALRLVEDLLAAAPSAGPYLVLASTSELGPLVHECVLVATGSESPGARVASGSADPLAASSTPILAQPAVGNAAASAETSEPVVAASVSASPASPSPAARRDPARTTDLSRMFSEPEPEPASPSRAATSAIPLATMFTELAITPDSAAAKLASPISELVTAALTPPVAPRGEPEVELEQLREQVAGLQRERDGMRERAAHLTQELRHAHAQAIDAGAELHELRRRVEGQRAALEDGLLPLLPDAAVIDENAALTRVLVEGVAPIVTPEAQRPTADVAIDRDRLREELTRRTADLQALETRLWQSEEEVQRERLENVRLVTDVDRLREQVDRSRVVEHERMQELERLGHELRRIELAYAELQGLYTTGDHRLRELEASIERGDDPPEQVELEAEVRELKGERDQAQALERAAVDQARRRERELAEAGRTIRELRRSVEEHASVAANLRGELAVIQVEVEQFNVAVPALQERLRDHQRKILEREEEAGELQRRLEESVAEQQELRQRLRRYKQDLEIAVSARETLEVDLDRLRGEVDAKRRSVEQLQQLVALGAGTGLGTADDHELQALRALLAQQTSEHADRMAQQDQQQRLLVELQREKMARIQLEATIRAEEQEYLLYQLDTAEQRIWEMTDATDRSAARLAAGLAQLDKQKEQYEDLIDQLEVSRTLLAEAQDQIVELERQMASDKAKLARLTLVEPGLRIEVEVEDDPDNSGFDVLVVDREDDEESTTEVAPPIQHDPSWPDPLAGIDFDDDEESLAVRLAGSNFQLTGAFPAAGMRLGGDDDDDGPGVVLPSDRVQIDFDDDDDDEPAPAPAPPALSAQPPHRATPKVLRTLPFLDDDDMFSIDTDAIEIATPTPPAPPPDRPGFDQKLTDHSNSRIVIEILDDEAWPDEDNS